MSRIPAWGWETAVFRIATAVALLHALDDAFLNRQPGVDLDQHALAAAISLAAGIGAILAFPRLRPGFRAAISFVFGVFAIVNGVLHVVHIANDGPAHSDLTGVAALVAGAVLAVLGVLIPFLHRGEGAATRGRRWANRLVAVVVGFLVLYALVYPTSAAIIVTHKYREPIGGDRTGGLPHAELLARHGYGVLVYDSRGRGESEGSTTGAPRGARLTAAA